MVIFSSCCYQYLSKPVFHNFVCFYSQAVGNSSVTQKVETGVELIREDSFNKQKETWKKTGRQKRLRDRVRQCHLYRPRIIPQTGNTKMGGPREEGGRGEREGEEGGGGK